MNKSYVKNLLIKIRLIKFASIVKKMYVEVRSIILRKIYPNGKYVYCNGARIYVDFNDVNYLWYYGKNEFLRQEHEAFQTLLDKKKPKVIIDIGAHWGIFPALLAKKSGHFLGSNIKNIICIEPDKNNLAILKKTLNKIENIKVDIVPFAISDKDGMVSVYRGGGACAQTYRRDKSILVCEVKAARLETILKNLSVNHEDVTHIKLDIDGYEPAFFYGAKDFLERNNPLLLIEFWANGIKASGYDIEKYWDFLHSRYSITEIIYPDNKPFQLNKDHLSYLDAKTQNGIANLLLVPK